MKRIHIYYNYIIKAQILLLSVFSMIMTTEAQQRGTFTDPRDGKTYETVTIGDQRWMAENVNYKTDSGNWCYEGLSSNCKKYGRLYNWEGASHACPLGWHLPSDSEWAQLITFLGGANMAWSKLKAKTGWGDTNSRITNSSGFMALPAGHRTYGGIFNGLGTYTYWWSATRFGGGAWYYGGRGDNDIISRYDSNNTVNAFSVRCIQH